MKVGVISDTHLVGGGWGFRRITAQFISKSGHGLDYLREIVQEHFKGVDRILHAGDLVDLTVLDLLGEYAPVDAVYGNMDHSGVKRELPSSKTLTIEGRRIGLIHGWGSPAGIVERVRNEFENVEAIVFGHTHTPLNMVMDDVLIFNPGSPIDRRFASYNTLGTLNIDADGIQGEIIRL